MGKLNSDIMLSRVIHPKKSVNFDHSSVELNQVLVEVQTLGIKQLTQVPWLVFGSACLG
jgi:hypothetical protein